MLRGMILIVCLALAAGCARQSSQSAEKTTRVELAVTDAGFSPASITVPAGKPITLVVTRKTDQTCVKEIVFPEEKIRQPLPLNQAVEIALPATSKGEISYVCGENMVSGKVIVQ